MRQAAATLRDVREVSSRAAAAAIGRCNTAASASAERGGRTSRPSIRPPPPSVATATAGAGATAVQSGGADRCSGNKQGDAEASLVSSAWPQCQTMLGAGNVTGM